MDLFQDLIPSLVKKKKYILDSENEKEYKPYIVNMALSQNIDCILYVNEINQYPKLDNRLQYDYYYHSLTAKNRQRQTWYKSKELKDLISVKEYFGFSSEMNTK